MRNAEEGVQQHSNNMSNYGNQQQHANHPSSSFDRNDGRNRGLNMVGGGGGNNMMNNNNNHGMPPPNYHPMHHDHHHHPGIPPQYGHGMGGMPDGMIPPHYPNNNMGHNNNNNNMFPPPPAPPRWNNSNNGMEQQQRHSRGGWDNHNHNYNHRDSGEHGRENSSMYRGGDRGGNRDEFGRGAGQRDGRHHDEHNRHSSNQHRHSQDSPSRQQDNKMAATMMKKRLREDMMAAAVPSPDDVGIVVPAAEAESTSTDDPSTWSQSKKRRMRTRRKKEAAKEQLVAGEGGDANRNGSADSTKSDDSVGDQSASSKNATLRNSDNSHECTTAEEKANSASDTNPESDRIQRRKEKKQRKKELRKQTKEVSIQNPSVKVTPTITDSSSPPQTNTETSSVEAVGGQHGSAGGMTVAVPPGLGMGATSGVPRQELSTSQPPRQQHQAQQMRWDPNQQQMQGGRNQQQAQQQYQEQQHYQHQQHVRFDQPNFGQMQQQPMYDQYGNQFYDDSNYQQQQYDLYGNQGYDPNYQQQQHPNMNNTNQHQFPIYPPRSIVHVKPLIVLDLNGILCHRIRQRNLPTKKTTYRPSVGRISNTEVIPRSDLHDFLTLLHNNFCLAVWTSAAPYTAKALVRALFPQEVSERLVFVWHRKFCDLVVKPDMESSASDKGDDGKLSEGGCKEEGPKGDEKGATTSSQPNEKRKANKHMSHEDIIAIKCLSKVWYDYPQWDATNTILLDDSPEKCPSEYRGNALHPPPICGTVTCNDENREGATEKGTGGGHAEAVSVEKNVNKDSCPIVASKGTLRKGSADGHAEAGSVEKNVNEDSCPIIDSKGTSGKGSDDGHAEVGSVGKNVTENSRSIIDDDEINQRTQRNFFQLLAKHSAESTSSPLLAFLEEHAHGHNMGWENNGVVSK